MFSDQIIKTMVEEMVEQIAELNNEKPILLSSEEIDEINSITDPIKQKSFERDYLCVFTPSKTQTDYLIRQKGWYHENVDYYLGYMTVYTQMNVLNIGNLTFYRPLEELYEAEFENFFGYGPFRYETWGVPDFSTDIVKFSYGSLEKKY